MLSEDQRKEILKKMSIIFTMTKTCESIKEIEEITNIPSSTIQRYLNKEEYFKDLVSLGILQGEEVEKAINYTKDWLNRSKKRGTIKGGVSSQKRYGYKKDNNGKFNGHLK